MSPKPTSSQFAITGNNAQTPAATTVISNGPLFAGPATVLHCQDFPTYREGCNGDATFGGPLANPTSVTFTALNSNVNGRVIWRIGGPAAIPWTPTNFKCVAPPFNTLLIGNTGGAAACGGSLTVSTSSLPVGQMIVMQAYQRDVIAGFFVFTNVGEAVTFMH